VTSGLGTASRVVCKRSKPPPPTADAAYIAIDVTTQDRYLCKDQSKVDWLPMAEWTAQHLARRCGLLVPDCYVIELEANPGAYLFGSKWEGGAEQYSLGIVGKVTNPEQFSAIYAFDLLIQNVDRHLNNYLYLQLAGDTVVKAVDHSRCLWFSGWPMPAPPPDAASNTMRGRAIWGADAAWDAGVARGVLHQWGQIDQSDVQRMLDRAPAAWIQPGLRDQLLTWWGSPDWAIRTTEVLGALP
jgi:hypothetical protein